MDNVYKLLTSIVVFVCSLGLTDGVDWCSATRYCESPYYCCGLTTCCSSVWGAGTIAGTVAGIVFLIVIIVTCVICCRRRRNGPIIYQHVAATTPGVTVVNSSQSNMAGMQNPQPSTQYQSTGQYPQPQGAYPPPQGAYPSPQGGYQQPPAYKQ